MVIINIQITANVAVDVGNGYPHTLLVRLKTSETTLEISLEVSQKLKRKLLYHQAITLQGTQPYQRGTYTSMSTL